MTPRVLAMPRLGETMEEGRISRWLKQPGDTFQRGEAILEIETDKTIAEFPALSDGRLVEILQPEGEMVGVDQPIAHIEDAQTGPLATLAAETPETMTSERIAEAQSDAASEPPADPFSRPRATPLARRLAGRHGIDIASLKGTGRRGRVEAADVPEPARTAAAPVADTPNPDASVRFADLPEGSLAYVDAGPRDGAVVLLLHGFAGDHLSLAPLVPGLVRAGRRVLAPDLPGHGLTTIEVEAPQGLSAPLPGFVEKTTGGTPGIDVVAHSLGAVAALALVKAMPQRVRSLTLLAPAGVGPEIDDSFIFGIARAATGANVAHWLRLLTVRPNDLSQAALEALAAGFRRGRVQRLGDGIAGPGGQRVSILQDLEERAAVMRIRVLWGLEDRIVPWRQVAALPSRVSIRLLSRSGHVIQWDQPQQVLDIILGG